MNVSPYKVLLVDDEWPQYQSIRNLLALSRRSRFEVEWISTCRAAGEIIGRELHDAYLIDYRLSDGNGLDLIREVTGRGVRAPMLVLTGYEDDALDLAVMKAGAADYLVKGQVTSDVLERSLRYAVERHRASEALRASQEFARKIINDSLDVIIAVDKQRNIIEFNRAAEETFGYRADEVIGRSATLLYAVPEEGARLHRALLEGKPVRSEVVNVRKNGERFLSFLSASALRNTRGEMIGSMGVSRDITEQRKTEQKLKVINQELEQRIAELTGQLAAKDAELAGENEKRESLQAELRHLTTDWKNGLASESPGAGRLMVCTECKKISDSAGTWKRVDVFLADFSGMKSISGVCPECASLFERLRTARMRK